MLVAAAVVSAIAPLLYHQYRTGSDAVHALAGPVIHSVEPERPQCIILNSEIRSHRVLTIKGENLTPTPDRRLQFIVSGDPSRFTILFGLEVVWESPSRITLDMSRIRQHLGDLPALTTLRAIVTNSQGRERSNYSDYINLALDAESCPAPGPTPIVPPTPFPATPPVRGVSGDLWADVIIGKPYFSQVSPNRIVPYKVFNPGGVAVDRSVDPGRMYVWDSGNSRILGIDIAKCYASENACRADIVIGQPSAYEHGACNGDSGVQNFPQRAEAGPNTLCGIPDVSQSPWELCLL